MDINLLKTIVTRLFGLYSQFKSIVSDLETNNTLDNREWAHELLNHLSAELYYEANCLTDVLFPPKIKEKDETMFKIDGIINAERNPMSEDEFCELFLKWAEENKLQFGGGIGAYREENMQPPWCPLPDMDDILHNYYNSASQKEVNNENPTQ